MKDIAIYGAGGLGREVACLIKKINETGNGDWNIIGFFDDGKPVGSMAGSHGKVIGGLNELNEWPTPLDLVLCFGNPHTTVNVRNKITNPVVSFPNIIHPDFRIGEPETFRIGEGNIIASGCSVTCNVSIGNYNLLNGSVVLGHDARIGDYNTFMPNVRVSGEVNIGNENLIGACSFVLQQLRIGNRVVLSPGSILLTRPKDGCTYIGNPAKRFKY